MAIWFSRKVKCVLKFGARKPESIFPAMPLVIGRMKNGTGLFLMSAYGQSNVQCLVVELDLLFATMLSNIRVIKLPSA